jgi:hypothetical protein
MRLRLSVMMTLMTMLLALCAGSGCGADPSTEPSDGGSQGDPDDDANDDDDDDEDEDEGAPDAGGAGDDGDDGNDDGGAAAPRPCSGEEDEGIDGVVDVSWLYFHDAKGRDLRHEGDEDSDGLAEQTIEFEWTDFDQLAAESRRRGRELTYSETRTYDDAENVVAWGIDGDGAGSAPTFSINYAYQADQLATEDHDNETDGEIDLRRTYAYDDQGRIQTVEDDDGPPLDGNVDVRFFYAYEEGGQSATVEFDSPIGGETEDIETYTYDSAGREVSYVLDRGKDGFAEQRMTRTYDSEGRLIELVWDLDGDDDDPARVLTELHTYEGDREVEVRSTGLYELLVTYSYECPQARISGRPAAGDPR